MNTTTIPTREQYEAREAAIFREQLSNCTPQGAKEFSELMATNPVLIAERIGWMLSGAYGHGACKASHDVLESVRMNRQAWMVQTIGAIEWKANADRVRMAWNKMTSEQQSKLNDLVSDFMQEAIDEVKINGRPA